MKKNENIWKTLAILAFVVFGCAFLSRSLNSSKTLYEYALENPAATTVEEETEPVSDNSISANTPEPSTEEPLTEEASPEMTAAVNPNRYTYTEGFYCEPITPEMENRIRGISYPEDDSDSEITLDDLSYVSVLYNDFEGNIQIGEIICNKSIALDLLEIFEELYRNSYQFEEISLIDKYEGDDTLSMEHNNTSCFNYRIVNGTDELSEDKLSKDNLSLHAYGLAIDINPYYNPYVVFNKDGSGKTYISPEGSEVYADRSKDFPYKIDENDLCYKLFIEHGFTWGGNWNSSKDYQHFQKVK